METRNEDRRRANRPSNADNYGSPKSFSYYKIVNSTDRSFFRMTGSKKMILRSEERENRACVTVLEHLRLF